MVVPEHERDLDRQELTEVVHQEIGQLPEPYRLVVILCELQGESYEAAAASLGVPVGTVRSRLSRARERLRVQITRRGVLVPAGLAFLVGGKAWAIAPSAKLIASTVELASPATVGGFAAVPVEAAGLIYAQKVLKASSLYVLGKATAAVAVAGLGLGVAGINFVGTKNETPHPQGAVALNPVVASSPNESTKLSPDAAWMQGRWVVVNAEQRGQRLDVFIDARIDIDGYGFNLTVKEGDPEQIFPRETTSGRLSLDPTVDPRRLELVEPGRNVHGLYRLDEPEQRLLLCFDHPNDAGWPRELASNRNSGQLYLVLRRDGPPGRRVEVPNPGGGNALDPKKGSPP
jgi:uncharacterized protein (TIGR03067 family)